MHNQKYPRIGIGVMLMNGSGEVLLGMRIASHGTGEWSFPGGHLEFGEKIVEAAKREVAEETGLEVNEFEIISVADEMRYIESDGKHYVNIGLKGTYRGGAPKVLEPAKTSEWKWHKLDELPEKIFEGTELTINNYLRKKIF